MQTQNYDNTDTLMYFSTEKWKSECKREKLSNQHYKVANMKNTRLKKIAELMFSFPLTTK